MQNGIKKERERDSRGRLGVTSGERDLVFGFGEKPHRERERERERERDREREYVSTLVF